MEGIDFSELPGYPYIFREFVKGQAGIMELFPGNRDFQKKAWVKSHSERKYDRETLQNLVRESMLLDSLSEAQVFNLGLLTLDNTLVVRASIKPSFLAGSISSIMKVFSTLALTKSLLKEKGDFYFLPLLLIEDDEPDNLNCSQAYIYDNEYNPVKVSITDKARLKDLTICSERFIDNDISRSLDKLFSILPESFDRGSLKDLLQSVYEPGMSWSESYIKLCSSLFGGQGVLFLRSSLLRRNGLYSELALKELENPGLCERLVRDRADMVVEAGYKIKPRVFPLNLSYHDKNLRFRIKKKEGDEDKLLINKKEYSSSELIGIAKSRNDSFSPSIILKTIFHDSVIPTAAIISGPSAVGHSSLLTDLYDYYGIRMPAFLPRHSVTLLDSKGFRLFRREHKDNLVFSFVFPNGKLQERLISPFAFINLSGLSRFMELMEEISAFPYDKHYSVDIS